MGKLQYTRNDRRMHGVHVAQRQTEEKRKADDCAQCADREGGQLPELWSRRIGRQEIYDAQQPRQCGASGG